MEFGFTSHIYPSDSKLRAVHLVVLLGYLDRKPLKLLDLEFANIPLPKGHDAVLLGINERTFWGVERIGVNELFGTQLISP